MPSKSSIKYGLHESGVRYATVYVGYDQDPPSVTMSQIPFTESDKFKSWEDNPFWKQQVKYGLDATTGFAGSDTTMTLSGADTEVILGKYDPHSNELLIKVYNIERSAIPGLPSPSFPTTGPLAAAKDRALQKFIRAITQAQRSFQSLVFAGELSETLHMIRNPAQALWNGIFQYAGDVKKRIRRRGAGSRKRIVQDTWLEYAFGWAPLVNDIKSGAEALAKLNNYRPEYQVVSSGFCENKQQLSITPIGGSPGGLFDRTGTMVDSETARVRYLGMVAVERADQIAKANMQLLGLSWQDIVPAVWELIPYSFLVDYFTNVGSILDAVAVRWGDVRWKLGTDISIREVKNSWSCGAVVPLQSDPLYALNYIGSTVGGASASSMVKTVNRYGIEGAMIPSLQLHLPFCNSQWINLAALARLRS